jgi:hypothetical protein
VTSVQAGSGSGRYEGMVPEGFDQGRVRESAAAARVAGVLSAESIDALLSDAKESGMALDGRDGLLGQMMKAVLERALAAEMTGHLGYEHGVRTAGPSGVDNGNGRASAQGGSAGNVRNGSYPKTVTTSAGPVTVDVPRDRAGEFEPVIVPKGRRRLGGVDEMILSLYARGMSTRDISWHLWEVYGAQASPALISRVTDTVAEEVTSWRNRPLDEGRFPSVVANHLVIGRVRYPLMASRGVLSPRTRRGRRLSSWATARRSWALWTDRSVPLGKYCRSSPLVFSFVPRCQGEWGSQK